MSSLTNRQATACLRELGWRVRTTRELVQAIKHFQTGWNLGSALAADGKLGPATSNALRGSVKRKRSGQSTASSHFSFSEVACKCGGRFSACPRIWMSRETFRLMETYRQHKGSGFKPVSGCRCVGHNRRVGGATQSQHLRGNAFDTPPEVDKDRVKAWRIASGIGFNMATDRVAHLDNRPGSFTNPTVWRYGR